MTWSQMSAATAPTSTVRIIAVAISTRRGEKRSVTALPISISAARGTAAVIRMVPRARLEPVSCSTSQGSATR
jgi:hypothetical protein